MVTEKQERSVIHLELNAEHYYFGSVKALCDNFGKEQIGIGYKSLANFGIAPDKPYRNKYCTIRKGILVTAPKAQVITYEHMFKGDKWENVYIKNIKQ